MKTTLAILILSLLLWFLVYLFLGGMPDQNETGVLVLISLIIVFSFKRFKKRISSRGKKE